MTQLSRRLAILCFVCITMMNLAFIPAAVAAPAPTADLVITALSISPSSPAQGVNATVSVTVRNQGTGKAYGFVVQWKSSQVALTGPNATVSSLNAGASTTLNFTYAFPNKGDFTTVATVDSANQVDETNETNNVAIKAVVVRETAADLYVTSFSVNPPFPVKGLVSTITIGVTNKGTGPSGAFIVQWRSDRNVATGPSQPVVPGLAAGATTNVQFQYSFPRSGNFTTVVQVDTANSVDELDEANNLEILSLTVLAPGIDLVIVDEEATEDIIEGFTLDPERPVQGRMSQATIKVQNQGNTPAGAFNVKWQPQPFAADISRQVNGLQPGEIKTLVLDHTFPLAGIYRTSVEVDSTHRVFETNEGNNTRSKLIVVDPPRSDLVVTGFVIDPNPAVAGLLTTATIGVKNIGNSPAGVFKISWRPSPLANDLSTEIQGLAVGQGISVTFDYTFPIPGEIRSVATVDSTDKVLELLENNNSKVVQLTVEVPWMNLVVSSIVVQPLFGGQCGGREGPLCCNRIIGDGDNPRNINEGAGAMPQLIGDNTDVVEDRPYQVCITVQNQGNFPTGPFLVEWSPTNYLDPKPAPPGLSSVSEQVDTLGPGQFATVIFEYTWPNPGDFRMYAAVDPKGTVRETDQSGLQLEHDNVDLFNVNVLKTPIDLTISSMSISPSVPVQGNDATMTIGVTNLGTDTTGEFMVEWNPGAFGLGTQGPQTVSKQVDSLGPGQTINVQLKFVYAEFGDFRSTAKVDALNNVVETNENNNLALLNVHVNPAPVDLVVTAFNLTPSPLVRGSKSFAAITVKNNGNYPVNNFAVQWKPNVAVNAGPVSFIPGLNANESKTINLETTYFVADVYTTSATVDVYSQVVETNEGNNVFSKVADVKPRQSVLNVTFQSAKVFQAHEDGLNEVGEWRFIVGILDPNHSCTIGDETTEGLRCDTIGDDDVEDGDTVGLNKTYQVTLVESTPLVIAVAAFEVDDFLGIPTGGKFTGFALDLWTAQDYLNLGSRSTVGKEGEDCGDGRCYDLNYKIDVVSKPPALATSLGATELPAPDSLTLPAGMSRLIPARAQLPPGVFVTRQYFLPSVIR